MRYVWVDASSASADADLVKGLRNGIDGYFFAIHQVTVPQLNKVVNAGKARGVYVGHNWWAPIGASALVEKTWGMYRSLAAQVPGLRFQMNLEQHDPNYILDVLTGLRSRSKVLPLSWAMEGMQGGWMKDADWFIPAVLALNVRFVPQAFWGADGRIDGAYSDLAVARDLTKVGVPDSLISPFYDGKAIPRGAQGYVFTQGRLP